MLVSAGSCIVFVGTLVHRAGANRTGAPRRGFTHEYCLPWLRPQENFFLSVPPARAAQMPPRLRAMLGYAEHPPSFGHIGGGDPAAALEAIAAGAQAPRRTE
jgi:ectoine hydroxylase-related dioxygenase (phytanoyl-CoA dioxygenase family)